MSFPFPSALAGVGHVRFRFLPHAGEDVRFRFLPHAGEDVRFRFLPHWQVWDTFVSVSFRVGEKHGRGGRHMWRPYS